VASEIDDLRFPGAGPPGDAGAGAALQPEQRDTQCQRFFPPGPPSTAPVRDYLAHRLIRAIPDNRGVVDNRAAPGPFASPAKARPRTVRGEIAVEDTADEGVSSTLMDPVLPADMAPPQRTRSERPASRASDRTGSPPDRAVALRSKAASGPATGRLPPAILPPLGRESFCSEPGAGSPFALGSASHAGPPEVEADKGNQDFAFHLEIQAPDGATWLLVGVADGVSQATWSSRAAQHASAAFVEAVSASFSAPFFPATAAKLGRDDWPDALAQTFYQRLRARLEEDRRFLFEGRYLDPTWTPQAYREAFLTEHDAFASTAKSWFQTTLLAAALGPEGGFALFLGDGYARVERRYPDRPPEISASLDPTVMISLGMTEAQVRRGIARLAPKGASHLGVLLSTDGVSKSPEAALSRALEQAAIEVVPGATPVLDRALFQGSDGCRRFLGALAMDPSADRDNMSLALAVRPLSPLGVPS